MNYLLKQETINNIARNLKKESYIYYGTGVAEYFKSSVEEAINRGQRYYYDK